MPQLQRPSWDLCLAWAVGSKHCALQRLGVGRQLASPPGPATGAKPWQVAGRAVLGTVLGPWPLASLPLWFSSTLEMSPESPTVASLCSVPSVHFLIVTAVLTLHCSSRRTAPGELHRLNLPLSPRLRSALVLNARVESVLKGSLRAGRDHNEARTGQARTVRALSKGVNPFIDLEAARHRKFPTGAPQPSFLGPPQQPLGQAYGVPFVWRGKPGLRMSLMAKVTWQG